MEDNSGAGEADKADEEGGFLIEIPLEVNAARVNDLGLFDRKASTPPPSTQFQHDSRQLLTHGSSLGSKLQARLKLVRFGVHTGSRACLIVLSVNFKPKSYTAVLRFRDAVIEVQVKPGKGDGTDVDVQKSNDSHSTSDAARKGPKFVAWHPEYLEGPAKTTLESFNISIDSSAIPPAFGGPAIGPNVGYSMSRERVKRRIIHGTIEDEMQRVLEWKLEENKTTGDGIPPACSFAFVVKLDMEEEEGFHIKMGIRAITVAGIPVVGKNTGAIYFPKGAFMNSLPTDVSVEKAWTSAIEGKISTSGAQEMDLAKVDLGLLTGAEEMLRK
ncbi:hypothetical protein JMJ35_008792 [Cladonia borealis]|uniref:Uncharacterized protein n=1 Tax=Cladonia borealis TaxID=184061 RepID=A0AA39QU99_9LECA|nr:hypothetical protein JMJ35_008792 [Cladonia borealis]